MAGELQGAAQGAAIGTAIMPGWGTAIGAVAGAFLGGPSVANPGGPGAGGASATPMAGQAAAFGSGLDGSGWQINFGDNSTQSLDNRQNKKIDSTGPSAAADANASRGVGNPYLTGAGGGGFGADLAGYTGVPPYLWLVAGVIAWRLYKSSK